uniref:KIB1-4 beta-propeller domain-containing protein n=1 Tax=Oryza brachyantha TaxID=4533 RepID=J3LEM7_ORYBR
MAASPSSHRPVLPCLAVECRCCASNRTFISAADKKPVADGATGLPSELLDPKAAVRPTPLGWVLVREPASGSTYLLDPQSRRGKIQLPPLTGIDGDVLKYCNCLLSDQPSAPAGCVVLLVELIDRVIWYHHIGTSGWTRHAYDIGTQGDAHYTDEIHIVPIAACHGRFYFNCFKNEISVLEFCPGPVFSSIKLGAADVDWFRGTFHVFLVESEGDLFAVSLKTPMKYQPPEFLDARVYKMDFSRKRWCLVDDLGDDRAFFVAPFYFGASCSAGKHGIQKNCVYFVRYLCDKSCIVCSDGVWQVHSLHDAEAPSSSFLSASWMLPIDPK